MKMSLSEMTWQKCSRLVSVRASVRQWGAEAGASGKPYILVLEVLEELELTVGPLGKDWCAERLHDLFDGDILACELVSGRAVGGERRLAECLPGAIHDGVRPLLPDQSKSAHTDRLEIRVPMASG